MSVSFRAAQDFIQLIVVMRTCGEVVLEFLRLLLINYTNVSIIVLEKQTTRASDAPSKTDQCLLGPEVLCLSRRMEDFMGMKVLHYLSKVDLTLALIKNIIA